MLIKFLSDDYGYAQVSMVLCTLPVLHMQLLYADCMSAMLGRRETQQRLIRVLSKLRAETVPLHLDKR